MSEPLDRRRLLARAGALAVAPGTLAAWGYDAAPHGWAAVRRQFALARDETNLSTFLLATRPQPVREAIARYRRLLDADAARYLAANEDALDIATRKAAARYLDADPDEIALTDSTTMGLGLLYAGVALRPGQQLVTSVHDFYATQEALRYRAERTGALLSQIQLYAQPDRASVDEIVANVKQGIGPRTRVLALTWVHSSSSSIAGRSPTRSAGGCSSEPPRFRADARARGAAQGAARRSAQPDGRHAARRRALVRARLRRPVQLAARGRGRRAVPTPPDRRERHPVRDRLRPLRPVDPERRGRGGRGGTCAARDCLGAACRRRPQDERLRRSSVCNDRSTRTNSD